MSLGGKVETKKRRGGKAREKARYIPGTSVIHSLDPRTRILLLVAITAAAIFSGEALPVLVVAAALTSLALLSGHFRHWCTTLWRSAPLVALLIAGNALFPRASAGPVIWSADFWLFHPVLTPAGIWYALVAGLRLWAIIGISLLFIMTTRFEDLVAGLRKLGLPYVFALSLGLSMRSVTFLTADIRAIIDAQRSRGLELERGGLGLRGRHLLSLVMPMAVCIVHRSDNVASAMLCRGYGYTKQPTMYRAPRVRAADCLMIAAILALLAGLATMRWLGI